MKIEDATPDDIAYVAARMRDADYQEFSALLPVDSRFQMVDTLVKKYAHVDGVMVVKKDDTPICIGATIIGRPNVATLFLYATDEFPKIAIGLTRWLKYQLFPSLVSAGVHRFECVSIEGHTAAHKWITKGLGLDVEAAELKGYGKNRENFIQFAKLIADADTTCP